MSSLNDPIRQLKRRQFVVFLLALTLLVPAGFWGWHVPMARFIEPPALQPPRQMPTSQSETESRIDPAVFAVLLWNPPRDPEPEPPTPAGRPQPAPALTAQLIAIVAEDGEYRAALFDPTSDELHVYSVGESIQNYEITQITETAIELRHGRTVQRLELLLAARGTP